MEVRANSPITSVPDVRVNSVTTANENEENDVVSVQTDNSFKSQKSAAKTSVETSANPETTPEKDDADWTSAEGSNHTNATPDNADPEWTSAEASNHQSIDKVDPEWTSAEGSVDKNDAEWTSAETSNHEENAPERDFDECSSPETSNYTEAAPAVMDVDNTPENDDISVEGRSVWSNDNAVQDGEFSQVTSCDLEENERVRVEFRRRSIDHDNTPDVRGISDNNSAWDLNYDIKARDLYDDDDVYENNYDIKTRDFYDDLDDLYNHGFKGICGRKYDVPVGEAFWCEDRQEGLRTNCVVVDKYKYMCCVSKYGCDDERDFKTWRF